jgi:3-phosphoshikimate 1-carboxyvinyltransferase
VKGGNLKAVDIDCLNTPDIVPTLAVAAAFAEGESILRNISQLRYKESDRISAIQSELGKMGIKTALKGEDLCIFGSPKEIHSAIIDSHNDHRIAMSFAVPGLILEGQKIMNPSCVAKSFPHFWELFDGIFTQ